MMLDPAEEESEVHRRRLNKSSRLERIHEATHKLGFVHVDDLADELQVSRMTIHRDLDDLQRQGALRKVRGGASAQRSTQFESDLGFRSHSAMHEKSEMAAAAAEFASEGDVVLLDDSTTALALVPLLGVKDSITVITNSLPALNQLALMPGVTTISLGGQYVPNYSAYLGMLCESTIRNLYADVLFASTSSLRNSVLYHQDQRVVATKRAMIESAQRRVLLLDHTKIGPGALHKLCEVSEFTDVVVDDLVDEAIVRSFEEHGLNTIVAPRRARP